MSVGSRIALMFAALKRDIREKFVENANSGNLMIAPLYDWRSDFPFDNTLYHETMGRRALHVELDESAFEEANESSFHHFFSQIGVDGEISYLTVYLNGIPPDWTSVWEIRKMWFDVGNGEAEIDALVASLIAAATA